MDGGGEMMKKYTDGEYMPMVWDCGYSTPDAYYIKGHVGNEDGLDILIDEGAIDEPSEVGLANHIYGRWSMEATDDGNQHMMRTYQKPGRGRFKVTELGVGIFAKKEEQAADVAGAVVKGVMR